MAIHRDTPKCKHCGKPIAEAIFDESETTSTFFGDSFSGWKYFECNCPMSIVDRKKKNKKLSFNLTKEEIEKLPKPR